MPTTEQIQNESHFEPQGVFIVDVDEDAAIANMERDSLDINTDEDSDDFEPHSQRQITTSATTSQTSLEFTLARSEDAEAMDLLGIRDDENDGRYIRDEAREKDRIEVWYYPGDADPTTDSPQLIDAFENCRVDVDSVSTDASTATLDVEIHVNGDVYWDTNSDLAGA